MTTGHETMNHTVNLFHDALNRIVGFSIFTVIDSLAAFEHIRMNNSNMLSLSQT